MTALQEVEALIVGLSRALHELRDNRPLQCHEGAVAYRFDTAIGLLEIMVNDANQMKREWSGKGTDTGGTFARG